MKSIVFYFLLLFVVSVNDVKAQIFTQVIDEQELEFKVKLIDEFFQRFNYETNYKGDTIDSMQVDSIEKRKNLTTLLNLETFAKGNNELDSISSCFLDYVIRNNKQIHYSDSTWYAEAVSSFLMDGKSYPIRIFLKTEQVKDVIYKWVISDVEIPMFGCLTDTIESNVSIMPGAHGTSFMTIPETVNLNQKYITSLFHKNYKSNILTVFAYLVSTNKIKLEYVTKVIYHFHLDGYDFTVERFERKNTYNNGWLISNIIKLKNND